MSEIKTYNPAEIEPKWQEKWQSDNLYTTPDLPRSKKFYALDMFPYPSGAGLHVGHPKGYIATDITTRYKMLSGFDCLHPMGWDAFGLPAENYAIQNKVHPKVAVQKNIAVFKKQLELFGFTYDWNREIDTTDPEYYRWTQWIFLQLFNKGLAFESNEPVNWCPSCKTVLANEDLEDGKCERCGSEIEQKPFRQWVLKMTAYADRLLYDLDTSDLDWEDSITEQQRNWIGRSEGATIKFKVTGASQESQLEVFTTRVDTIFGCTYCVVAPEHKLVNELKDSITNIDEILNYISAANKKTVLERTELQKEKTGVKIEGISAINPFNQEEVPIFIADYVLGNYGTGAVMAVPAHDERDFEFAHKYNLPIIKSIETSSDAENQATTKDGILVNSGDYSVLTSAEARQQMIAWLEQNDLGNKKVNYKMRDWVFSRQRYWGEPIPVVHCQNCGVVGVPESELPVVLPDVESYEPTGTGESPLANIAEWVNTTCPTCGGPARRETNTMPQWGGSCWYYLRYIDPNNQLALVDKTKEQAWMSVDLYVGGAEHATRHLLYARFWHKFLFDIGVVSTTEPFKKLVHVGLIMGEDSRKMSKRWGNVINPDDVIKEFGADSLRLYEMFMGPFTQSIAWSTKGVVGVRRFLERVWKLQAKTSSEANTNKKIQALIHQTVKKVSEDIDNFRFNTAISSLMILVNELEKFEQINIDDYKKLIILLAPFAPHITEEIWTELGNTKSIFAGTWPEYDEKIASYREAVTIVVQINGKIREQLEVAPDTGKEELEKQIMGLEKISKLLEGGTIKKIIHVPNKLVNIVI